MNLRQRIARDPEMAAFCLVMCVVMPMLVVYEVWFR